MQKPHEEVRVVKFPNSGELLENYHWFAYVLSPGFYHREVVSALQKAKIEFAYCFVWDGLKCHPHGYCFFGFKEKESAKKVLNFAPFVAYWLPYGSSEPLEVDFGEIEAFLENLRNYIAKRKGIISVGDIVSVPENDMLGEVIAVGEKEVLLRVHFLGREVTVRVRKERVKVIPKLY